jgi:hypothetical protein
MIAPPQEIATPSPPELTSVVRRCGALALCVLLAAGCGGSSSPSDGSGSPPAAPVIGSFSAVANTIHVGESTQLTAVFSGDSASIDGVGLVQSGVPVATPALARATTFTLTVRRASQQVEARLSVAATYRDRFRALVPASVARTDHVAAALADGGALVMGGNSSESVNVPDTDSSDRFDPVTETFSSGPQLAFSAQASFTTPVELVDGTFLLVGGGINSGAQLGSSGLLATQAFDATTGTFHRVGDLGFRHDAGGTATALRDGSVLVAGGQVPAITAAERYDPASGRWTSAGNMTNARRGHTATRLADGRVLIAGGVICCNTSGEIVTGTAEIYDPASGGFQPTGSLVVARGFHTATLLADGRVLVTGGFVGASDTTASTEIYDPSTAHFSPAGAMQVPRSGHSAIALTDGRVLVLGGLQSAAPTDIFEPSADRWSPGPNLQPASVASTVTLLRNGKVLIFGGADVSGFPVSTVLLYE